MFLTVFHSWWNGLCSFMPLTPTLKSLDFVRGMGPSKSVIFLALQGHNNLGNNFFIQCYMYFGMQLSRFWPLCIYDEHGQKFHWSRSGLIILGIFSKYYGQKITNRLEISPWWPSGGGGSKAVSSRHQGASTDIPRITLKLQSSENFLSCIKSFWTLDKNILFKDRRLHARFFVSYLTWHCLLRYEQRICLEPDPLSSKLILYSINT